MVNEDINQCEIFDGNGTDAKLMGLEYIISKKLFDALTADEKKLWHSHVHEVKSGQLVAPGVPPEKRKDRESILAPAISPGADAWQQGDVLQLSLQPLAKGATVPHSQPHQHAQPPKQ